MANEIPFVQSYLIALWLETLLYGSYAVLFSGCMHILVCRRAIAHSRVVFSLVLALFLLSTVHIGINCYKNVRAFTVVDDPSIVFEDFSAPIDLSKEAVYVTTAALADTLLIFRCYMVWGHHWRVVVLPALLLLITTGAGYFSVYQFSNAEDRNGAQYADALKRWFTVMYSAMLANNVLTTTLIASRIWVRSRVLGSALGGRHQAKYNRIVAAVIESGAIYAVSLLIYLILYTMELQAQKVLLNSLCQIACIMPTLIIVRMGLGLGPHDAGSTTCGNRNDPTGQFSRFFTSTNQRSFTAGGRDRFQRPSPIGGIHAVRSSLDDVSRSALILHPMGPMINEESSVQQKV